MRLHDDSITTKIAEALSTKITIVILYALLRVCAIIYLLLFFSFQFRWRRGMKSSRKPNKQ